jgi:hypothetical protein
MDGHGPANTTFEGPRAAAAHSAGSRFHPIGDLAFDPSARPRIGLARALRGCGDSAAGEQRRRFVSIRSVGHLAAIRESCRSVWEVGSSTVSENGRYRIPNDNPFAAVVGARKEI